MQSKLLFPRDAILQMKHMVYIHLWSFREITAIIAVVENGNEIEGRQ